jgi:hypothetical protein
MGGHRLLALALIALALAAACAGDRPAGGAGAAVSRQQVSGCGEALRERSAATSAIDAAEKQALQRNRAWSGELQRIASEGKHGVLAAADLAPCEGQDRGRGVVVDLADLRARYRVVVDRTVTLLNETAARPVPQPQRQKGTKGTKD